MTTEQEVALRLADKWIKGEQQYRGQVIECMAKGIPFTGMAAHADQLRECRRELQTAFNLVTREKDKGHL